MDGNCFDAIARRLATTGTSRRGLLGLAVGFGAALAGRRSDAAAACPNGQYAGSGTRCLCRTTGRIPGPSGCPCGAGETSCDGVCRDLSSDEANCGSCGAACPDPRQICQGGRCFCPAGLTDCGGICVDLSSDPNHCGSCPTVCPEHHPVCRAGVCGCAAGLTDCDGTCVDLLTDPAHCGSCPSACTNPDTICSGGRCVCPADLKDCGNACCAPAAACTEAGTCCVPKTCRGEGKNCGVMPDGCGGTVDCGPFCKNMCIDNVCSCPNGPIPCRNSANTCSCLNPTDSDTDICVNAFTTLIESTCTDDTDCPGGYICSTTLIDDTRHCRRVIAGCELG